jgi:tetratricopeptide (TPR) repeat protein
LLVAIIAGIIGVFADIPTIVEKINSPIQTVQSSLFYKCPQNITDEDKKIKVLIATFENRGGESQSPSSYIYDYLLSASIEQDYLIGTVATTVTSQEQAIEIGKKCGVTFVIWGWFDKNGISPHIETVEWSKDLNIPICLLKFQPVPLLSSNPDQYINFVTSDLPKALEYFLVSSSARINFSQSNYEEAISSFTKALNLNIPNEYRQSPEELYYYRGLSYYSLENYKQAIPDWEAAIKINSSYVDAYD